MRPRLTARGRARVELRGRTQYADHPMTGGPSRLAPSVKGRVRRLEKRATDARKLARFPRRNRPFPVAFRRGVEGAAARWGVFVYRNVLTAGEGQKEGASFCIRKPHTS